MSLPPVDEITERWGALVNKAEGNPGSEDAQKLRSTPFNTDTFLPYSRPLMKFYKTTSEFLKAPKCEDSFKGICSRSSSTPSSTSIPVKQCMVMEAVKREHVQMLGFVSLFLKTLEKCASNMEEIVHAFQWGEEKSKELEELLSCIQIQYSCLGSVDKALEMVTDVSMTMACNLQLARRDTTLKQCAPHLHKHNRNHLRRSGFMSRDLFSPAILNAVEKKLEKER